MKRTITATLAATALFGLTACKGGGSAAAKLIPEQATIVGGIDLAGVMKSKLYTDNKDKAMKGPSAEMIEAGKACNIDVEKLESIVFGTDADKGVAVVITGPGVGEEANLNCVAGKIKEKNPEAPFTIEGKEIKMGDEGTAYIVDGKTLAFASAPWAGAVKELVDGKGKSAMDGSLKDLIGKADQSKHIWFAGKVPAEMAAQAQAEGLESVYGSIHLASGVDLNVTGVFADAEKPASLATMINGFKEAGKTKMPDMAGTIDGVKVEAKDKNLEISASIPQADVDKAMAAVPGMM
ncbi:MAG: hypothetical protein KC636_18925 [Myxococcales bacterium]|nr:hypothetical protein [Myxococcales bacterium]